jgi:formylglycine-generating enzyme required for sulfatase activity
MRTYLLTLIAVLLLLPAGMSRTPAQAQSGLPEVPAAVASRYLPFAAGLLPPPEMILIPAGPFKMGCSTLDNQCNLNEKPEHSITLSTYSIDKYEVTNVYYRACAWAGGCLPPPTNASVTRPSYFNNPVYNNYPVVAVTFAQAQTFCRWMGKRLPTEAEWEKAARSASGKRIYPWGVGLPGCNLANYLFNVGQPCVGDTAAAGSSPGGASPYGVLDMAGNVWEWTADWYAADYYKWYPVDAWPPDPVGPPSGEFRSMRGGGWDTGARSIRSTRRVDPLPYDLDTASGFRCAK